MLVTVPGIVTSVRLVHEPNEESPMLVMPLGILIPVRLKRSINASSPMLVTIRPLMLVGMVTSQGGPA